MLVDKQYYFYQLFLPSGITESGYLTNISMSIVSTTFDLIVKWDDHQWLNRIHTGKYERHTICNIPIRLKKVSREDVFEHMTELYEELKANCKDKLYVKTVELQLANFTSEEEIAEKIKNYVV